MKENAGSVSPKRNSPDRSYPVLAAELVDRLSSDQSSQEGERGRREGGREETEREARRISSSTGSINHQGESENPDSWRLDGCGGSSEGVSEKHS